MSGKWTILRPYQIIPGMTARPTSRGIVTVDLHYTADPLAFSPAIVEQERRRLGCTLNEDGSWTDSWRWRKEMELDWTAQAGQPVFDPASLQKCSKPMNPIYTLDYAIEHIGEGKWAARLTETPKGKVGPIRIYLAPGSQPAKLPANSVKVQRAFGIGSDVSEGVGSSNSTLEVFASDNWEQAASFASDTISPTDLGRLGAALGQYYNGALVCPVSKMHGMTTLRALLDECGYAYVWRDKARGKTTEYSTQNHGWPKGETSSPQLFGRWMDAVDKGEVILHDLDTISEHTQYIYDVDGRITHQARVNLPPHVRDKHGDRVIGCALALRACIDLPQFKRVQAEDPAPWGSFAWRQKQRKARERAKSEDNRW